MIIFPLFRLIFHVKKGLKWEKSGKNGNPFFCIFILRIETNGNGLKGVNSSGKWVDFFRFTFPHILRAKRTNKTVNDTFIYIFKANTLSTFLCSKLDDHYTVSTAALPGLNALLKFYSPSSEANKRNCLDDTKIFDIIKSLSRDIHVQSMVQSDRLTVFTTFQFILTSKFHTDLLKSENFETDFVYGFIQSLDGEKGITSISKLLFILDYTYSDICDFLKIDPRNLLVCFECIKQICQELHLGPFVEETFEVFACYFPIDFTPVNKKEDRLTILNEINELKLCLTSFSPRVKTLQSQKNHS